MFSIEIQVDRTFKAAKQEYVARIYLYLPTLNGKYLPDSLVNEHEKIFDIRLASDIGRLDINTKRRVVDKIITAKTIEELNKQIDEVINSTINQLKQVYDTNRIKLIKTSEIFEVVIN